MKKPINYNAPQAVENEKCEPSKKGFAYFILICLIAAWLISCLLSTTEKPLTVQIIHPRIVREMTASYSRHSSGKSVYGTDTTGGAGIDPANGMQTFNTNVQHMFPYDKMYGGFFIDTSQGYPDKGGTDPEELQVLYDFTGATNLNDTTNNITFSAIWGASSVYDTGDSMAIYDATPYFRLPLDQRWKAFSFPKTYLTLLGYLVTQGGGYMKWQSLSTSVSTRYIIVQIRIKNRGSYSTIPDYNKLVFYGNYNYTVGSITTIPDQYTGPRRAQTNYDAFAGTNYVAGQDTLQSVWDSKIRVYGGTNYWDKYATFPLDSMLSDPGFSDIGGGQYPSYKRHSQLTWWNMSGGSQYLINQGGPLVRCDIDSNKADPRNPYSYVRSSRRSYLLAAYYGSVAVSTANTTELRPNTGNGKNILNAAEFSGNEEDEHGSTIQAMWSRAAANYDGYENRVGISGQAGAKNADPSFTVISCPTTLADTNFISVYAFYSQTQRTDKKQSFDVFTYHHYSFGSNRYDYDPTYDQQVGESGISPAQDNLYKTYLDMVNAVYKYMGITYAVYNTEWGYSNWGHAANSTGQASLPWDLSNLPSIPGYDSSQVKANYMMQGECDMQAAGLDAYNEYSFCNATLGADGPSLFSSSGRGTGRNYTTFAMTTFKSWYYVRQWKYNNLKGYHYDSYVENHDTTGRHIHKYRNTANPNLVAYVIYNGVYDSTTLQNQSFYTGVTIGNGTLKKLSYTDSTGSSSTVTPAGGYSPVGAISMKPMILFLTEGTNIYLQPWKAPAKFQHIKTN